VTLIAEDLLLLLLDDDTGKPQTGQQRSGSAHRRTAAGPSTV